MDQNTTEAKPNKVNPSIARSLGVLSAQILAIVFTYKLLSDTDWKLFFASLACLAAYGAIGEMNTKNFPSPRMLEIVRFIHLLLFIATIFLSCASMSNAGKILFHR